MTAVPAVVLPPFPEPLRPFDVGPSPIAQGGLELVAASARLDDAGSLSRSQGRLASWEGMAGDAYRRDLEPFARQADAMSLALRSVGRRVESHADAIAELVAERDQLDDDHVVVTDQVFAITDAVRAWQVKYAGAPAVLDAVVGEEGLALQVRANDVGDQVRALDQRHANWWERVLVEEEAMVEAFDKVLELDQVDALWGDAVDPADSAWATKPAAGASAAAVLAWWRSLSWAQQRAVVVAAPGAVGNLDGIPAADRDAANRVRLSRDLATWRHLDDIGQLTGRERAALDNAEAAREALDRHDGDTDAHGDDVPVLLWTYDPSAFEQADGDLDGRVAIAVGDPDTADHVAVNVPGIKTEADDIGQYVDRAWELHRSATTADPSQSYSSIAWLGYDAPREVDSVETAEDAATSDSAERGGDLLADAFEGLRATSGDDTDLVPIGHSYGSVTMGAALTDHHLGAEVGVDRAVAVGSPGLGVDIDDAGDLGLGGDLYVGQNFDDPVADAGTNGNLGLSSVSHLGIDAGHGQDPADSDFGAVRFQANAGEGHDDHSAYYDTDSESLHNLGAILAGQEPTSAGLVEDPWIGSAQDPEDDAPSEVYDTDGDGDTDGIRPEDEEDR